MIGEIVSATREHAIAMAPRVRAAEVVEARRSDGIDIETMLLRSVDASMSAWTWLIDGEPACMFGVVSPIAIGYASFPWFFSTPLVESHSRAFARACRALLPELLEAHPRLSGMVDATYDLSLKWLRWLGFTLEPAQPYGPEGALFHPFHVGG